MNSYIMVKGHRGRQCDKYQIRFSGRISKFACYIVVYHHTEKQEYRCRIPHVFESKQCYIPVTARFIKGKPQQETITLIFKKYSPQYSAVMYSICMFPIGKKRRIVTYQALTSDIPCICNSLVFHFQFHKSIQLAVGSTN